MNNEISNEFCIIPPAVWKHKKLNLIEKCLLGRIYSLSHETGYCFAGNDYIANELGKSPITVSKIISKLVDDGFLIRTLLRKQNNEVEKRILKIDWIALEKHHIKSDGGMVENDGGYGGNPREVWWKMTGGMVENDKDRLDIRIDNRLEERSTSKKSKQISNEDIAWLLEPDADFIKSCINYYNCDESKLRIKAKQMIDYINANPNWKVKSVKTELKKWLGKDFGYKLSDLERRKKEVAEIRKDYPGIVFGKGHEYYGL